MIIIKRIIFLIIRLLYRIPGWLFHINKFNKSESKTQEEKYDYGMSIISKIVKKARVEPVVFGKENLPSEDGYLLAPNHQGMFDPLIIMTTLDTRTNVVLKKELTEVFVLKDVIKLMGLISIDRENLRQSMSVIKEVTTLLENKHNCIIFAEGTRSKKQNELLEFKGGSFKCAVNAKAPIVPVCLIDSYKVFDNNSIKKVIVQLHYLKPIEYDEYKDMNTNEIAQLVQSRIEACMYSNENRF